MKLQLKHINKLEKIFIVDVLEINFDTYMTGVALITHIMHVHNIHKKNIYNKVAVTSNICFFTIGAALKRKNLPLLRKQFSA